MKKSYKLEDLCCANCAAKIEDAIRKLDGVNEVSVLFLSQKLILDTVSDDQTETLVKIRKIINKIEPDCRLVD